ncbi:VOC family protein [Micromonospora sp. URMC 103]|uniref:VOC family protein n=1 Tax=Micromonospora sp. URMC 103 TaxID=3423406 RepID=UPI003F1A2D3B
MVHRRSDTSGARRSRGRWCGTRTRRPPSARPTAAPRSRGGGPPLMPGRGRQRLHFDVAPPAHGDQQAEVDRLLSLGATRIDMGPGDADRVVLADPDGNEFCVLTPR